MSGLPEDILLRILSFLSPPDIIRLRQVSKTLYSATQQPVVWIRAYKNAALPRPPGPYLRAGDKEGLDFLERALVQLTKLEPWSARKFHLDPVRTYAPGVGDLRDGWHLLQWESWVIITIESSVVYVNLDSGDLQTHVLFRLDDSSEGIDSLLCADTVTLAGHPITYAVLKARNSAYPLTLLKIVGHFRSSLSVEAAIPLSYPRHDEVSNMIASPRYICIFSAQMPNDEFIFALLDVTTEKIYYLPPFMSTMAPEILERFKLSTYEPRSAKFLLTDTHILVTSECEGPDHHIQAFRLPSEVESSATAADGGMLQMTHEGICKTVGLPKWVLRGNKVTSVGGVQTTEIRAMTRWYYSDSRDSCEEKFSAIDLTLTASSSPGIGTITLSQETPLSFLKDESTSWMEVGSSEDGFGRGVRHIWLSATVTQYIQTFSVDASGPVCRADFGPRRYVKGMEGWETEVQCGTWSGKVYDGECENIRVYKFV